MTQPIDLVLIERADCPACQFMSVIMCELSRLLPAEPYTNHSHAQFNFL